ncbi:MAG TPA: hypothetical protein VEQ41_07065 [Solirubrobacterales bacterium]|nr:hypothetical protein [Solirubrobacterales bacterium]
MSTHQRSDAGAERGVRRDALAPALALFACLALLVAATAGTATAAKPRTTVVLGETASLPDPSCPDSPCQAVGSTTGFQVSNGQSNLPFLVPDDGVVKSWTLTLAEPTNQQRSFFNGFFGMPPQAQLAILRRVPGTQPPRYSLRAKSSIQVLTPYLGETVRFGTSLRVRKADIVGVTIPTWAPAFAQGLSAKNVWRASREEGACTDTTDVRQGEPHERLNSRATYGCKYSTARLLYTATVVLD